jgi:hypothetical protein
LQEQTLSELKLGFPCTTKKEARKKEKRFFFEKKKQKTFAPAGAGR